MNGTKWRDTGSEQSKVGRPQENLYSKCDVKLMKGLDFSVPSLLCLQCFWNPSFETEILVGSVQGLVDSRTGGRGD